KKGKSGDLYVRIVIKPHPLFKRAGDDLFTTLFIPFTNAVLGGEVEVSTLEGTPVTLSVPEGSESGRILKVPGRGVPHFHGLGRGNLAVELKIKVPKKPTREQRELLDRMKKEGL
ncbi:MAG: molecular chaperone DnaJ, partial [Candidatus Wildermuthbacteria bacterium]|nr:molecular chaperone DnaJ [Candidatus Wildermuthbacteria bacterium]